MSEPPQVRMMTEELLQSLTQQVVIVQTNQEMALVAGDFNQFYESLIEMKKWEALGWREVQSIAQSRWNMPPVASMQTHVTQRFSVLISSLNPVCTEHF